MELIITCIFGLIFGLIACGIGLYLIKENNELTGYNNVLLSLIDKRTQELIKEKERNKQFVVPDINIEVKITEEEKKEIIEAFRKEHSKLILASEQHMKAHWIEYPNGHYYCSNCDNLRDVHDSFCEHCGAEMFDDKGNIVIKPPEKGTFKEDEMTCKDYAELGKAMYDGFWGGLKGARRSNQ